MTDHNALRDEVHAANVTAGWWSNIQTGESILSTRNRPEMFCLINSELMEAYKDGTAPDGHLPQYRAFEVELADAAIRILDLSGADGIDLSQASRVPIPASILSFDILDASVMITSHALEAYRKGRTDEYHAAIQTLYHFLFAMADAYQFDLMDRIRAKTEYNANRADHKVENRLKDGGKKL